MSKYVANGGTPESNVEVVAVSSEGEQQACSGVTFSQSQSSSQTSSSQESELYCSESMVSSDGSQLVCQSPRVTDMENKAKAYSEKQDPTHEADTSTQSEALKGDAPIPGAPCNTQAVETEKPAVQHMLAAASFSANSSLSQLADLAVGKAHQYQGVCSTGIAGSTTPALANQNRMLIPGQHLPLPLGGQQPMQVPVGFGAYRSGPLVQVPSGQFHGLPQSMQIPPPFLKGSIIQLASGELKRVEDLNTHDFIQSTKICPDLKLESSTIIAIQECGDTGTANVSFMINSSKAQVALNCPLDHPFFVYDQGWSSCCPELSQYKFKLQCHPLKVGDTCIFLSPASSGVAQPGTGMSGGVSQTNSSIMVSGNVPSVVNSANTSVANVGQSNTLTGGTLSAANFPNPVTTMTSAQIPSGVTLVGMFGQTPVSSVPSAQTVPGPPDQQRGDGAGQLQVSVVSASPSQTATQEKPPGGQSVSDTIQVVGSVRPQQSSVAPHQLLSTDPKEGMVQSTMPMQSFYNPLMGTVMTPLPGQAFMQGSMMPSGSVGNGLLMAALGMAPGRAPTQYIQPGMLYGPHLSEMAQKQADSNQSSGHDGMEVQREQTENNDADLASPEAKKLKLGSQVTGLS